MVARPGIEPGTFTVSRYCSTTELPGDVLVFSCWMSVVNEFRCCGEGFDLDHASGDFSVVDASNEGLGQTRCEFGPIGVRHLPHEVGLDLILGCLRSEPNPKSDEEVLDVSHRR